MPKRLAMVLTMLLIVGIGQAWGETYSYTFTAKQFSANGSKTLNSVSWTLAGNGNYWGYDGTKGQQFGSGSAPYETLTLSTSGISGTITKIIINTSGASSVNASFTVSVGGTQWGSSTKLTTSATEYTFTGSKSGEIKFSYTQTSSKALYIKSISVTYETAAATVPVTGVSLNKSTLTLTEGNSETLTATITPANATDKTVTWSTSDANIATVSNGKVTAIAEGSATITVKTKDGNKTATCSVTVNPKPKYTVTWNVNGEVYETTQVTEGNKPTFPVAPSSCDATSTTFYGWATATWDGKINDVSAKTIYTSANDMPAVNGAVPYYAVFATKGAGGVTAFDGTSGGDFKIYALVREEKKYLKGTGSKILPVGESEATEYTFTKIGDGVFSIKTGTTYLTYASSTNLGTSNSAYSWNISKGTKGSWRIASTDNTSRGIVYRAGTTNQFGGYATSNITANGTEYYDVEIGGGSSVSYSDYITTCAAGDPCDALQAPNVTATATANSITLSWAAVDGATSYNIYNYTTEDLDETTSLTYTFTGLSSETEYEWGVESAKDECFKETRGTTTTSATPCEQLGAATGLTVETDFVHTDGQTYVKFSWTPADNTKANATNQKICFGKVGEAGTCVDDLEKNLTWTGDLKSKLEPGEYWWSIQALGDGVNYCDGDVVNGTNFTIEAPTYTVEWFVNGEEAKGTPTTSVIAGQKVTVLPTTPTSADCDDNKVFVGWTDTEINGTSANAPTNLYKELGDFPAINANTIYYAVFAEGNGAAVWQKTDIANITPSDEVVITMEKGQLTYAATYRNGTSSAPDAVLLTSLDGKIDTQDTPISETLIWNISNSSGNLTIYPNGTTASWLYCTSTNNGVRVGTNSAKTFTIDAESGYLKHTGTSRFLGVYTTNSDWRCYDNTTGNISGQTLAFYKKTSSFTNYSTTCVTPVWETNAATIDKTFFTVNCGERSPMTGANSAAKITFPTDKIYNFTSAITIEATTGFLVSTSQSVDVNYQSSVSLSPRVGTTNANTFYDKFVYVRAEAPAQSDTDLEGTITIKNSKGETLQTFSVTADVTCTTYTLTLNDRGSKTTAEYYAGASVPKPADPIGVCTEPIHYVFDGWAEATVANGSTEYTKVTFPYTMPGQNKTLYAVYRYLTSGGNGDYNLVTSALDDWSGDYLIAYSDLIFANGKIGGKDGIGAAGEKVDLSSYITNNTIPAAEGDKYKVSLEAINGGYLLKTQDGKYNYQSSNTNGLEATTNKNTATNYKLSVNFVSFEEINLCLSGNAEGAIFQYNTDQQGYFRFYKNGGQEPVHLYKKASGTTLYTTSPICSAYVEITSDKDIYVTGGNAGGTRSLVVAQKKITFSATRLQPNAGGNAPSIKVPAADITIDGNPTTKVALSITQDLTEQGDGTYAGTGEITISYTPTAFNVNEDINVQLRAEYNTGSDVILDAFTVHARSLPQEFVIVAKQGDKWYALNGDMSNGSSANPANGQITLDDNENPTKATYAPCNTIYTFDGLPNTGDRKYVRFQGTDGAWLWAASGTNVGIQNKTLAQTPTGDNKPYNWKLETEDNITYKFHNDNSSRLLGLSGEKFGMYASGVQDIRILPYVEKCLYNYAPTNLKVSVLKGTYVTLTWDAVAGATKYQYRTDATNWTDAGTEPTVTINGLEGDTEYIYYIRAYHEDAGVSQECIDYEEITFTTADCDDVPTNITYTADLNSITVSWTAAAPTATIKLFMDEEGAHMAGSYPGATSPYKISGGLDKNTTYYIQILADGTCASPIIPVKTEDVEVDIVEWDPQGIIVDINTDETIGVTLENEVSYGSGLGTEATELFFSKYYEASYNVKLVAIYNGTKNIIDLTDYIIKYGKTSWESNYITLKDFGATKGQIQPGEEIILYSMQDGTQDDDIMECVHEDFPDGNWVEVTSSNNTGKGTLAFGGDKTLALFKGADIIDIIGAVNGSIPNNSKANEKPAWGDAKGWICATGLSLADDSEIGISTNRCLLVRNNTVTSGANAVASNTTDFVTLCSEWKGAHVLDSDVDNGIQESCENFAYVGTFDYSDYYTKYVPMGEGTTFDENARNADGTVTIPITDLYKYACSNIRVKLSNSNGDVLTDREYKVPIMITSTQGTNGQTFLDLQQNLATKEVDAEGNVIRTYPLTLDEVREICKTCDVVVRDNATLTKVTDGTTNDHSQVHDVIVYEGASIVIPDGNDHNYTINSLSLRRKGDDVASAQVQGTGKFVLPADAPVTLSMRIDANNWHWFTLPYDCDIADVTWSDGTPAKYNTDWFLMYYDGESRAASTNPYDNHWKVYSGTTIEAGKGYIIGITGNLAHPNYTFELRFPMEQDVLTAEQTNKTVALNAWGVKSDNTPNNLGWNLVGNPYLNYYQPQTAGFEGLSLLKYTGMDPVTGDRLYDDNSGNIPFLVTPIDGGWYEYQQELASDVQMMPFTAYFVQVGDPATHENGQALDASFTPENRAPKSLQARRNASEENNDPAIVAISLTNAKGESDKTTLLIADRFTNEYEMNADFFKWFGDYYKYYTKPVLYTLGADQGKRAFNALSEQLAAQPVALGLYAAQAGNYTFSLNQRAELYAVAEVWLHDANNNTYTNLMQEDYTTSIAKTDGAGRFSLSVKMMQKLPTDIENTKQGNIWATTQNDHIIVNGLAKDMQLWIYDATGKLLHADRTTNYQHSYSASQTGTYFIRVQNTTNTQTIKVVVE